MPDNTVFIVDDDAAVRSGLKFLLQASGYAVECFGSARSFLDAYDPQRDGCLLLDVEMPSMTGLELQQELNRRGWQLPVIFITGHGTVSIAVEAIKAGAFDMVEKPLRDDRVLGCIRRALGSSDARHGERLLRAQLEKRAARLTPREWDILMLVADGEPNKVIGRRLGISFRTVEAHRAHILEKLQARSPSDLVRLAAMLRPPTSHTSGTLKEPHFPAESD